MIMKKLFTTALLACFAWNGIHAQFLTNEEPDLELEELMFPYEYGFKKTSYFVDSPMIYTENFAGDDCIVDFYDENLTNSKTITLKNIKREVSEYNTLRIAKSKDGLYHILAKIDITEILGYENPILSQADFTQYLFNQDNNLEYIEVTCDYTNDYNIEGGAFIQGSIIKVEIKNENGDVIGNLPPRCIEGSWDNLLIHIGKIGNSYYVYSNNTGKESFWKLNLPKEGSGISASKVKSLNGYPNPVKKNEYFHINLDNKFIGNANIEIWDSKGSLTYKIPVTSSTTKIPTANLKGLYIYKVTDTANKESQTGKFIVQ